MAHRNTLESMGLTTNQFQMVGKHSGGPVSSGLSNYMDNFSKDFYSGTSNLMDDDAPHDYRTQNSNIPNNNNNLNGEELFRSHHPSVTGHQLNHSNSFANKSTQNFSSAQKMGFSSGYSTTNFGGMGTSPSLRYHSSSHKNCTSPPSFNKTQNTRPFNTNSKTNLLMNHIMMNTSKQSPPSHVTMATTLNSLSHKGSSHVPFSSTNINSSYYLTINNNNNSSMFLNNFLPSAISTSNTSNKQLGHSNMVAQNFFPPPPISGLSQMGPPIPPPFPPLATFPFLGSATSVNNSEIGSSQPPLYNTFSGYMNSTLSKHGGINNNKSFNNVPFQYETTGQSWLNTSEFPSLSNINQMGSNIQQMHSNVPSYKAFGLISTNSSYNTIMSNNNNTMTTSTSNMIVNKLGYFPGPPVLGTYANVNSTPSTNFMLPLNNLNNNSAMFNNSNSNSNYNSANIFNLNLHPNLSHHINGQQSSDEFHILNEDFPALPGLASKDVLVSGGDFSNQPTHMMHSSSNLLNLISNNNAVNPNSTPAFISLQENQQQSTNYFGVASYMTNSKNASTKQNPTDPFLAEKRLYHTTSSLSPPSPQNLENSNYQISKTTPKKQSSITSFITLNSSNNKSTVRENSTKQTSLYSSNSSSNLNSNLRLNTKTKMNNIHVDETIVTEDYDGIITHPGGRVTNIPTNMVKDQFGMVGLLTFIRSVEKDPYLVSLGLGSDLTTFGLNLNSSEPLYQNFDDPFAEKPAKPFDIDCNVPPEYLVSSQIRDKLPSFWPAKYVEDLLFFLFYAFENDLIQILAAQELYERDWRFYMEEKIWITKIPGINSQEKSSSYERGTFYFFDPIHWRKLTRDFTIHYDKLDERPNLPNPALLTAFHLINSTNSTNAHCCSNTLFSSLKNNSTSTVVINTTNNFSSNNNFGNNLVLTTKLNTTIHD